MTARTNPGRRAYAAAVAEREALRQRELAQLRVRCATQEARLVAQQKQISLLRQQLARSVAKARGEPPEAASSEAMQ